MGVVVVLYLFWVILVAIVVVFFFVVGFVAHAFDELFGCLFGISIGSWILWVVVLLSLVVAVFFGVIVVLYMSLLFVLCIVLGVLFVFGYNFELFGGRLYIDIVFVVGWGGFFVVVGFFV